MLARQASRRGLRCGAAGLVLAAVGACGVAQPAPGVARADAPVTPVPSPVAPSPRASFGPAPSVAAGPLTGALIVVDPGHNGGNAAHPELINRVVDAYTKLKPCDTTGAQTHDGYFEHAFNWDTAVRLAARLRSAGAMVVMTRSNDTGVGPCLTDRAEIGNRYRATVAIAIHADSAPADAEGFHVIEPAPVAGAPSTAIVGASHRLAVLVRDQLRRFQPPANYIGEDGINTRDDMGGLNLSRVPKVMVECGNMRNAREGARMRDAAYRERLAAALAAALIQFVRAG